MGFGKSRLLMIALLASVVAVSGCSQREVTITENDGLSINSFIIDPSVLDAKRPFRVFMEVENTGGTTARNVNAQLFGINWNEDGTRQTVGSGGILSPPDIRRNVPGSADVVIWNFDAPGLTAGIQQSYLITGRVNYDYTTSSVINIPVYNEEEQKRRTQRGGLFNSVTNSNTRAPIKVDVTGADYVLVRDEEFEATDIEESFYKIFIRNVGSGVPITEDKTGLVRMSFSAEGLGRGDGVSCNGDDGQEHELKTGISTDIDITIREGREALVPCTLKFSRAGWDTKPQGTLSLIISLKYEYFIEKIAKLTVFGRGEERASG